MPLWGKSAGTAAVLVGGRSRRRAPYGSLAVVGCALLAVQACGSRLSVQEARAQLGSQPAAPLAQAALSAADVGVAAPSGDPGRSVQTGAGSGGAGTTGPGQPEAGRASGSPGAPRAATAGTPGSAGSAGSAGAPGRPGTPALAPILIGMDCNCSGVVGAASAPARDAYRAWVQMINAKGGIDGHPVKLLYADDNNSASQDLSNVKQFVESDHVVALVNLYGASGGDGPVAEYAQRMGIPIVGGDGYTPEWTKYPGMFSTATSDPAQDYAWAAELKAAGNTRVGSIYCVEGRVCADKEAIWKKAAESMGMTVVHESQKSLASPDFSSDCLSARNAGVQGLVPIMDGASAARVARDCTRQGYTPTMVISQPFENPPSYLEGAVSPLPNFPWFLTSGSPALVEYGQAMDAFTAGLPRGSRSGAGWANGKLLEKALTGRVSAVPSPSDVFAGLWAMKGETLGGLTAPLSFAKGRPAAPINCSFRATVKGGIWTAPVGMALVDCAP